ncbi:putative U3 small nucleolar RNA-associated protein 7 isoform X1 [Panicum miliaceum]|uniref:U3 small nucleolar RNA-associated protein 7 isoform X1 n=1 Tax=Panicum miliaceum TaxID=4540 RepID=A0A3L6QL37_PANMI|nr:putative U3 small nucleolar RNA-associated protein 7 isoform X1 [Panicum miliaceum]
MAPAWVNADKPVDLSESSQTTRMPNASALLLQEAMEYVKALKLQFLTKQFLLASINSFGQLHYQDVSTGDMIAYYRTGASILWHQQVLIWDLRKYKVRPSYGIGRLYMKHRMKCYQVGKVLFRPYEDIMAMGHSMGLSSILVPRSGEPNFDTFVDNPMETTTQKWEEVHALLKKMPLDTIMLNPILIATVRAAKKKKKTKKEIEEEMEEAVNTTKNMER